MVTVRSVFSAFDSDWSKSSARSHESMPGVIEDPDRRL